MSRAVFIVLGVALGFAACAGPGPTSRVIDASIDRYGGELFDNSRIHFSFRGTPFEIQRADGRFRYQRTVPDSSGVSVLEVMQNEGSWRERDGERIDLDSEETYDLETAVNSVVYFGFLPFRLDDEAVIARDLGPTEIAGEPYHTIEVTFREEGGGTDWDSRFVHWIHSDDATLDYFAYRYSRDGGGARFRRAVNRRTVAGLLVQDYENYAPPAGAEDIADYARLYESGQLELVSMVELEDVEVAPLASLDTPDALER